MNNAARFSLAIATMALSLSAQPAEADLEPQVVVVQATLEQAALVDEVVGRFEAVGLRLPNVTIAFHDDQNLCRGHLGYYAHGSGQLDVCNWGQHYRITPATTLLHELGHAWSFEHISEAARQAFVEHQELETWNGDETWWHNGQEHAAELIAWVVGGEFYESGYLDGMDHAERVSAAQLLLGDRVDMPVTDGDSSGSQPATRGEVREPWRTTPDDYCEIGTTCAYCWTDDTSTLGCWLRRIQRSRGRHMTPAPFVTRCSRSDQPSTMRCSTPVMPTGAKFSLVIT